MKCREKAAGCHVTYEKWTGHIQRQGCCQNPACMRQRDEKNRAKKEKPVKSKTAKPKFKPRKWYIKKLDDIAKGFAKERDGYICQKSGVPVEKSNAHGSHVVPVSAGHTLRWDLNNIKCLSYHNHINWWHKNPTESGEWFKQDFPERWEYIQDRRYIKVKISTPDLADLYSEAAICKCWQDYSTIYHMHMNHILGLNG